MKKKKFKFNKLPICHRYDTASFTSQKDKIIEEYQEFIEAFQNLLDKFCADKQTEDDFRAMCYEAFDLSQASQMFIHLACKGQPFGITESSIYKKKLKINKLRGYYEVDKYGKYKKAL